MQLEKIQKYQSWVKTQQIPERTIKESALIDSKLRKELKEELSKWTGKASGRTGMIEFVFGMKNDFSPGTYTFLPEEGEITDIESVTDDTSTNISNEAADDLIDDTLNNEGDDTPEA